MHLLPEPKSVNIHEGTFFKLSRSAEIYIHTDPVGNAKKYKDLLTKEIHDAVKTNGVKNNIVFNKLDENLREEEYVVHVKEKEILLTGGSEAGLLYAVQTLRLLIREYGEKIPSMTVSDYPSIKTRGYSYDTTRGRVPKLSELKRVVDLMSLFKLNHLELNVEHSFEFMAEKEIWKDLTPLTKEDILALDEYCQIYHVELVPMIASFGHLYHLLQSHKFSKYCELPANPDEPVSLINRMRHHTLDVTNIRSFELSKHRIKEFSKLFSSGKINICADETFDLGKGKSKALCEEKGTENVYIDFLNKLCSVVKELGKTPMYWGDIIVKKPEILKLLPEDSILLNWEYEPDVKEDNIKAFVENGAKNIFVCPGVQSWSNLINDYSGAYRNISKMCALGHKYGAIGVLNTDWGDLGHIGHPECSNPAIVYGANFSWSDKEKSEEDINKDISVILFKDSTGTFMSLLKSLTDLEPHGWWWPIVSYKETKQGIVHAYENYDEFEKTDYLTNHVSEEKAAMLGTLYNGISECISKIKTFETVDYHVKTVYITMAQGMLILIRGLMIVMGRAYKKDFSNGISIDIADLKKTAEHWFKNYIALWRHTSKESELFRIREICEWYYKDLQESENLN
ncbi:MAG: beta-N-acetylhexosaminidase [Lachnospiraceae bacterium]|nr:beta-N-acetylhexosaminidase [Lachnospiraceae bacterium]